MFSGVEIHFARNLKPVISNMVFAEKKDNIFVFKDTGIECFEIYPGSFNFYTMQAKEVQSCSKVFPSLRVFSIKEAVTRLGVFTRLGVLTKLKVLTRMEVFTRHRGCTQLELLSRV